MSNHLNIFLQFVAFLVIGIVFLRIGYLDYTNKKPLKSFDHLGRPIRTNQKIRGGIIMVVGSVLFFAAALVITVVIVSQ